MFQKLEEVKTTVYSLPEAVVKVPYDLPYSSGQGSVGDEHFFPLAFCKDSNTALGFYIETAKEGEELPPLMDEQALMARKWIHLTPYPTIRPVNGVAKARVYRINFTMPQFMTHLKEAYKSLFTCDIGGGQLSEVVWRLEKQGIHAHAIYTPIQSRDPAGVILLNPHQYVNSVLWTETSVLENYRHQFSYTFE